LPAVAPGTIEHWLFNHYYKDDEALLFAIADAMHEEYKLITDSGLNVQIDDPDLPDGWQMFPHMTVGDYRKYATLRVEALNHALRGIPEEQVRLHICWGSGHGPHKNDLPLEHFVDVVLQVHAQVYSIEAANPRHEHEWRVWEHTRLPSGKSLMPGVVGHATDIVEHPRLVADRLVRYANLVGKENVIAGTDCGVGSVWNDEIAWAKFSYCRRGTHCLAELWARSQRRAPCWRRCAHEILHGSILPTTMVGSYPRPNWFTQQLDGRDIRVAFKSIDHAEAFDDATRLSIQDQEEAWTS
jgi:5-methyltetrahydropteroyltriglutamate--homocysteine methyltransferase